jgi:hypothetical protein
MSRQLLVSGRHGEFKITIPDDAIVSFGPWSPPVRARGGFENAEREERGGTLRIYLGSKQNIVACFAHVKSFRDLSLPFAEQVAVEEGSTIWKDDQEGYTREHKVKGSQKWVEEPTKALPGRKNGQKR